MERRFAQVNAWPGQHRRFWAEEVDPKYDPKQVWDDIIADKLHANWSFHCRKADLRQNANDHNCRCDNFVSLGKSTLNSYFKIEQAKPNKEEISKQNYLCAYLFDLVTPIARLFSVKITLS